MKPILAILICCLPLCACQTGKTPTAQPQAQETPTPAPVRRYYGPPTTIHLVWDANDPAEHVTGYNVYKRKLSIYSSRPVKIASVAVPSYFSPVTVTHGAYIFHVTAVNAFGMESLPSNTEQVVVR